MFFPASLALLVGWMIYFTSRQQSTIFLVLLIIGSVVLFFFTRQGLRKAAAANNVVAAAATFNTLSGDEQSQVHGKAIGIIKESGWRSSLEPTFDNDVARFGWYALAMAEVGIKPVCITPGWNFIRNPFIAIAPKDSYIDTALQVAQQAGFNVALDRTRRSIGEI
jgi:hypothetical protein